MQVDCVIQFFILTYFSNVLLNNPLVMKDIYI